MKTMKRLQKYHSCFTVPNDMSAYCGHTRGKMSINGSSTIFGILLQVINKRLGHCEA